MQIDKDLNSDYAELFLDVRKYITLKVEEFSTKLLEKYSDNITTLYTKEFSSAFCYIRVKENHVHIGWFNGAKIVDKPGLFLGNGKYIRGHKIYTLDTLSKEAIGYYVQESYYRLVEKEAIKEMRK